MYNRRVALQNAENNEVSVKNKFFTREFVPCGDKCRRLRERHGYLYD